MLNRGRRRRTPPTGDPGPGDETGSVLERSIIGTATRVGLVGISLANAILVARALGPTGLGQFFLFVQLVALLGVLADGGLSNAAAAIFGRDDAAPAFLHGLVLRMLPVSAIITTAAGGILLALLHGTLLPHLPLKLLAMAFATLPFALYCNVCFSMLAGLGQIRCASAGQMVGGIVWLVLTVVFVVGLRGGVATASGVYGTSLVMQAAFMAVMAVRVVGAPTMTSPAEGAARRFLSFSVRAFPGAVAYLLLLRLPAFILNVFQGPAAVGIFSAAQQLAERALLPAIAVQSAAYWPMSSRARQAATVTINRYLRFSWWGMTAVLVVGAVLAPPAVHLLFGPAYEDSAPLFRVLLPGVLFSACALILDTYFLNQLRRPGLLSSLCAVQAALAAILGMVLIPRFAGMGAAASLTVAQVAGTLGYAFWHVRLSGSKVRDLIVLDDQDLRAVRSRASLLSARRRDA